MQIVLVVAAVIASSVLLATVVAFRSVPEIKSYTRERHVR
jgi:hypothetical protein